MDIVYSNSEKPSIKEIIESICAQISKITRIPNINVELVFPTSCEWYNRGKRLAKATPSNEAERKHDAIISLLSYPVDVELTGQGTSRYQTLCDLPSSKIIEYVQDASGVLLLKERYENIVCIIIFSQINTLNNNPSLMIWIDISKL